MLVMCLRFTCLQRGHFRGGFHKLAPIKECQNRKLSFYPRRIQSMGQGNVFTDVCLFTMGAVCLPTMPWEGRPPSPLRNQKPPPCQDMGIVTGYGQQAGGTHPTGMHPC